MKIVVGIATAGRREILSQTLTQIGRQTRLPDRIIVAPGKVEDVDTTLPLGVPLQVLSTPMGICLQRNGVLDAASDADILVFFDHDYFPADDFLAVLEQEFRARPSTAMITGKVLADGILGPGLTPTEALEILAAHKPHAGAGGMQPVEWCYGCNMAINMAVFRKSGVRFDETLPLYAWLEDEDFSRSMARHGELMKSAALTGVHLGVKSGRTPGIRLGYSQIANPVYLWRKGTLPVRRTITPIFRNIVSNVLKSLRPEPWVDRHGRLRGNLLAVADMLTGKLVPTRILELR